MPPKKEPPKKKLTKKELKELEEQRKKEEKERLEEEERKKEELRKLKEEEQRKEDERLAKLEKQRLQGEQKELDEWRDLITQAREEAMRKVQEVEQWEKYRNCSTIPDPSEESQITTFITQYKESPGVYVQRADSLKADQALDRIQYSELVSSQILHIAMRCLGNGQEEVYQRLLAYIVEIRKESLRRLEEVTAVISLLTEEFVEKKLKEQEAIEGQQAQKNQYNKGNQTQEVMKVLKIQKDFKYGYWINPVQKGYRHKAIEFVEGLQGDSSNQKSYQEKEVRNTSIVLSDVSMKLISSPLSIRALWTSFDYLTMGVGSQYTKDLVVGGVVSVEFLEILPPKKKVQECVLKYDFEFKDAIKYNQFVEQQAANNYSIAAFKMQYQLPAYVKVYADDLLKVSRVACYCEFTKAWVSEQIQDVKYEPENKQLTFMTYRVAPYAYLQDRCTDFPYKSWKIRCIESGKAVIDIEGKRDTFQFEVSAGWVKMRNRTEKELEHLNGVQMMAGELLQELQKSGINLLPLNQDAESAGIVNKDTKCEQQAIQTVCLAVRSFYVKSSRFSGALPNNKILIRVKENLEYDENFSEDQEKDWKSIQIYPNKVKCVKARDSMPFCDEKFVDDTVAHGDLQILLREHSLTNKQAIERIKETKDILFQDTLSRFLRLTHLLSFTQSTK